MSRSCDRSWGSALRIEVSEFRGAARFALAGEFDIACADRAARALRDLLERGPQTVEIDLRGLAFMDSTGVKFLVDARDAAREAGARLAVLSGGGAVERILAVSGVMTLFAADARPMD